MLHPALRRCTLPCVLLALATTVAAQTPFLRCGTPPRDPNLPLTEAPSDCGYRSTTPSAQYAPTFVYRVPVVFHVIMNTNGTGNIPLAQIQSQVDILNEDFLARTGTPGGKGSNCQIEFHLATVDPNGNPTTGVTYSTNNTWFGDRGSYWNTLAWDTNRYLNVYTDNPGSGILGYVPALPQSGSIVGTASDRVVVLWSTVGRNAPYGPPYDQGRSLTHEIGHYFGLWHTFEGGCGTSSCYTTGDLICDTASESRAFFGCGKRETCGTPDPTDNYMDYTDDPCMTQFTPEQAGRMRCTIEYYRPQVAMPCAIATVTTRNAGSNVQSYVAGPPLIGQSWHGTVDVQSTGHTMAGLFGFAASATVPLGSQMLLVDTSLPPIIALPAAAGPNASFQLTIPSNYSMCGAVIYTQAVHYGGAAGFVLTDAQDLTLGAE